MCISQSKRAEELFGIVLTKWKAIQNTEKLSFGLTLILTEVDPQKMTKVCHRDREQPIQAFLS